MDEDRQPAQLKEGENPRRRASAHRYVKNFLGCWCDLPLPFVELVSLRECCCAVGDVGVVGRPPVTHSLTAVAVAV